MDNFIKVNELEMGMILAEDVVDPNTGVILVAKNMGVTKTFIANLINKGIERVRIKQDEIPAEKYNHSLMDKYSEVENSFNHVFMEIKEGVGISTENILEDMEGFVQEITRERDILTQMRLLKNRDDYTFNHSLAVSTLATSLGKWLGYSKEDIMDLAIAGLFHDIGKLKISKDIINKPGELTFEEFEMIKKHSTYSAEIVAEVGDFNHDIILGILQHHERIDGSGYPDGLVGDEIHRYGKIIGICDIYHALTTRRVYKDKENPLHVAEYIRKESFSRLDPYMTQVFLKNISKFYVGNKVVLSTGEIGEIIYIHPQDDTKPIVQVDNKFIDFLKEKDIKIIDIVI